MVRLVRRRGLATGSWPPGRVPGGGSLPRAPPAGQRGGPLELLLDVDHLVAAVLAAVRADAGGELGLVAVRADRGARLVEGVVGAPAVAPGLRGASLGIGHGWFLLLNLLPLLEGLQPLPPRIDLSGLAAAGTLVQVGAAGRAEPGAALAAQRLHRY